MCPVAFDFGSAFAKDVVGVDIGAAFAKAVVFSDYGILAWAIIPANFQAAADEVVSQALAKADVSADGVACIVATGCGAASVPAASQLVDDISCEAKGIIYLFNSVRTVINIGKQSIRVFRVDKQGRVVTSVASESQAVSRLDEGASEEDIAAEVQGLVEQIGFEPDCTLIGGGAKNTGLVKSIERGLAVSVFIPQEPQIVAALGAALIAEEKANSRESHRQLKRG